MMRSRVTVVVSVVVSAVGLGTGLAAAQPVEWLAPVDGFWNDPLRWDGGVAPTLATQEPVLGLAGAYLVVSTVPTTHGRIMIANPAAVLRLLSTSHTVHGDLLNAGTVTLRGVLGASMSFTDADRRIDGTGVITLEAANDPADSVIVADGVIVTHAAGHTINGNGRLTNESDFSSATGAFRNRGLIVANDPAGPGLELRSVALEQAGAGRIGADGGTLILSGNSEVLVFETSITGGELFVINGGSLRLGNTRAVSLNDMTVSGLIDIDEPDRELRLNGAIDLQGRVSLNPSGTAGDTTLRNRTVTTVTGNGEIVLRASGANGSTLDADESLTIGAGITVRGSGTINCLGDDIVNEGSIVADDPAEELLLEGDFSGAGLFGANGGRLVLGAITDLDACTLDTLGGGVVVVSENFVDFFGGRNEGDLELMPGANLKIEGLYTNNGTISQPVTSADTELVILRDGATITGDGRIEFFDDFRSGIRESGTMTATIGPDQTLFGAFTLDGDMLIEGTIEPEGKVEIDGDVVLAPTAVLRMELDDPGLNDDRIDLRFNNGSLTLGGTLELAFEDGVVPFDGQAWFLIDGEPDDELLGFFDAVVPPDSPPGFTYVAEIVPAGLRVTATAAPCPADIAAPFGVLDLSDINAFIAGFVTQDPIADLAPPAGVWDLSDVNAFIGSFVAGCP
jgi:hypothetical protein